jgi:hypothetical protein
MRPDFDPRAITDLDVRDDLRSRREPLPRILQATAALAPDGILHLRTTFLPAPLVELLGRQGFHHHSEQYAADDWSTWFWKGDLRQVEERASATPDGASVGDDVVDLRAYPPPQPLTYILERVDVDAEAFDVLLPFFPAPLVGLLEPIGRAVVLVAEAGDGVRVRIEAAAPA